MIKKPKVENNINDLRNLFDHCMATIGVNRKPTKKELEYVVEVSEMFFQCLESPDLFDFLFKFDADKMN